MEPTQYSSDINHEKKLRRNWIILAVTVLVILITGLTFKDKLFPTAKAPVKELYSGFYLGNGSTIFGQGSYSGDFIKVDHMFGLRQDSSTTPPYVAPLEPRSVEYNKNYVLYSYPLSEADSEIMASSTRQLNR